MATGGRWRLCYPINFYFRRAYHLHFIAVCYEYGDLNINTLMWVHCIEKVKKKTKKKSLIEDKG